MVYTETKERNGKKYYYRVKSVRKGKKVLKEREYLGVNLNAEILREAENMADKKLLSNNSKTRSRVLGKLILQIKKVLKRDNIKKAGIFGSYARGEQREDSDIDILIKFDGSLLALVKIERELAETLGKKIDLLTYSSVHPLLKKRILSEEVRVI